MSVFETRSFFRLTKVIPHVYDDAIVMRLPRRLLPVSSFLALLCLISGAEAATTGHGEPDPSGTYQGRAPAADAARRVFILSLSPDGIAILTTRYLGKDDAVEHGRWTESDGQLVLAFDPIGLNQPSRPITFRYHHHRLRATRWDPSEWGSAGPPVLYRVADRAGSSDPSS